MNIVEAVKQFYSMYVSDEDAVFSRYYYKQGTFAFEFVIKHSGRGWTRAFLHRDISRLGHYYFAIDTRPPSEESPSTSHCYHHPDTINRLVSAISPSTIEAYKSHRDAGNLLCAQTAYYGGANLFAPPTSTRPPLPSGPAPSSGASASSASTMEM